MRLFAALLVLALGVDAAAAPTRAAKAQQRCRFRDCARTRGVNDGRSLAMFEFAPEEGFGMTAPCACVTPTGAKGEVMTFSRGSSGTCLKARATSGIANGELVTCSTDTARVMPGGDGSGGSGLLVEETRTNTCVRSQQLDDLAWTPIASVIALPTVTANAAVAPDGTTTAERVQFPAANATATAYSQLYQLAACTASNTNTASIFVKGNGTSGTLSVRIFDSANTCVGCVYSASTWTRCSVTDALDATPGPGISIGSFSTATYPCTGSDGAAFDGFLWGGGCEIGQFATSYIATAGVAVARAADTARFSVTFENATGSIAATLLAPLAGYGDSNDHGIVTLSTAAPDFRFLLDYDSAATAALRFYTNFGAGGAIASNYAISTNPERFVGWWDSSTRNAITPTGSASGALPVGPPQTTIIEIGQYSSAGTTIGRAQGVVKRVCVDPSPGRCR